MPTCPRLLKKTSVPNLYFSSSVGEALLYDALARQGVIEAVLVGDDADVPEVVEEDQRPELVLLLLGRRRELAPEVARRAALERDARLLKDAPHKARAVVTVRPLRPQAVGRPQTLLYRREHHTLDLTHRRLRRAAETQIGR